MVSIHEQEVSPDKLSKSGMEGSQNPESPNAIDVAYLYCSTDVLAGWTSSLPWKADDLIDLRQCPISGDSVAMICDGMAMAAMSEKDRATNRIVRFKYGKKTYQLSTAARARISTTNPQEARSSWLGSWFGMATSSIPATASNAIVPTEIFAQDRIAEALDLVSLKILHKGSLLFDSQSLKNSKPEEMTLVSRALLKISDDDWNTENRKKKATLVVMGTRKNHRLNDPSRVDTDGSATCTGGFQILKQSILIPFHLVYWPCKMAWYFVLSFLEPFLPSHRMLGNSDDSRPHQD